MLFRSSVRVRARFRVRVRIRVLLSVRPGVRGGRRGEYKVLAQGSFLGNVTVPHPDCGGSYTNLPMC